MYMIPPIQATDAILVSSNITETEHSEWSSITAYSPGDYVQITTGEDHSIYYALTASTNQPPATSTSAWLRTGATNRWKPFDQVISDQATRSGSIQYSFLATERITAISFFGLDAQSIRVQVNDTLDQEVYDETVELTYTAAIINHYEYDIWPGLYDTERTIENIPGYVGYTITVTIISTGTTKVGQICFGNRRFLARTLQGTKFGIRDHSRKEFDELGRPIIVPRRYAKWVEFKISITAGDERRLDRLLSERRVTPTVYYPGSGLEKHGCTVYGFFVDYEIIPIANGSSEALIRVDGLV